MEEKNFSIFSREYDQGKIMNTIMKNFGVELSSGNKLHLENNSLNIITDIEVFTNSMGDEIKEFIEKQKNMTSIYFSQIQDCNEDIKINLIHHIQLSKAYIPIIITFKKENGSNISPVISIIHKVLSNMDGILITNNGKTAMNSNDKIILSEKGESDLEFYFPFEFVKNPAFLANCTERQIERRNKNMEYLFDKKIYVCELPLNDDDEKIKLRSHEDVVKRTIGTLLVSLYSESLLNQEEKMSVFDARNFINKVMKCFSVEKLDDVLTEDELSYVNDDDSDISDRINFSWHYENLYVLEWILCLEDWNYPDRICDVRKIVRNIQSFSSVAEFCEKTIVRSKKEILEKADLIYRMDWAAVDARIHGSKGPAGLDHGIVQERHKTLNWMICFDDADWDDVPTPT